MGLLDRQDLLHNHQFLVFIDLVKCGKTMGNVKPVYHNPSPQDQFLLIPLGSRVGILLQPLQGSPDDPSCFLRQTVDLFGQFVPDDEGEGHSSISESET